MSRQWQSADGIIDTSAARQWMVGSEYVNEAADPAMVEGGGRSRSLRVDAICPINWLSPLNSGLVAWYLCIPGWMGGSRWVNLVRPGDKDGDHGTLTNGPIWQGAQELRGGWGSLLFDGSDDYVNIPDAPELHPASLTICGWFRTTQSTSGRIVLKSVGGSSNSYSLGIGVVTPGVVEFRCDGMVGGVSVSASGTWNDGLWHHVCATYDGSTCAVYIDGQLKTSGARSGAISYDTSPLQIGRYGPAAAGEYFSGSLDSVRICNRALSVAEISALYWEECERYRTTLRRHESLSVYYVTAAVHTGTAAVTLAEFTCDVSGSFTAPTYTGTATPSLVEITAASSGTHTAPIYTGSTAGSLSEILASASGTHTAPIYTGTAASSLAEILASETGTFTGPVYTGSATLLLTEILASVSGTHSSPVYTGSAAVSIIELLSASSGTHTAPTYTSSITATIGELTASASGIYATEVYSGSSDVLLVEIAGASTGTHISPVYSGTAAVTLSEIIAAITGIYTAPTYSGTAAVSLAEILASATGTFTIAAPSDHILGKLDILPAIGGTIEVLSAIGGTVELNPKGPW